ncbi:transcriptional regulator [Lactobacillus sp.]|uniref:transcriptional regulator n=1 Tax=Lactobacillus sp. TaxID=1591 RepID=UPI001987E1EB|nr:transcriptional regulator [Lactobacillus sp.]MBD5429465.1 helix-turn-helix transcriptional regulator [Lactobacillus sp.]
MTIGEALKDEQRRLGLNNKQMAGNIMSQATYSKVINEKQILNSEALVQLLLFHDIDVEDFFEKLKETYISSRKDCIDKIRKQMFIEANTGNLKEVQLLITKLKELELSDSELFHDYLIVADLTKNLDKLDSKIKNQIINKIKNDSNWINNLPALRLFATSLVILSSELIEEKMSFFFFKISRMKKISEHMLERYAMLCDNYLHWKFDKREVKNINVQNALSFLYELPDVPHFMIYRISEKYYRKLFDGEILDARKIKVELLKLGSKTGINNWPQ